MRVNSAVLGDVAVSFRHIESVRFLANRAAWPRRRPADASKDVVATKSGEVRAGKLVAVSRDGVTYHAKHDVKVALQDCAAVLMDPASRDVSEPPKTLYAVMRMSDDSVVYGAIVEMKDGKLKFTPLAGAERTIASAHLSSLYFRNGRVAYLSDFAAGAVTANETSEYVKPKDEPRATIYPWQRDRNAKEGKLSIGDEEFRKGIGVHAKSELTFDLSGGYSKFEARIGIDDVMRDSQVGNVVFVVLADGKEVWKSGAVTWRDRAKSVSVDIAGAKKLTLLVDWGEDFGNGDFADWALARVVR